MRRDQDQFTRVIYQAIENNDYDEFVRLIFHGENRTAVENHIDLATNYLGRMLASGTYSKTAQAFVATWQLGHDSSGNIIPKPAGALKTRLKMQNHVLSALKDKRFGVILTLVKTLEDPFLFDKVRNSVAFNAFIDYESNFSEVDKMNLQILEKELAKNNLYHPQNSKDAAEHTADFLREEVQLPSVLVKLIQAYTWCPIKDTKDKSTHKSNKKK